MLVVDDALPGTTLIPHAFQVELWPPDFSLYAWHPLKLM
jgi:hypothetical protein